MVIIVNPPCSFKFSAFIETLILYALTTVEIINEKTETQKANNDNVF